MDSTVTPFADLASDPPIRGFLHEPAEPQSSAIVLTHGAGANCQSKLLIAMSDAFAAAGFTVLRFDLPFRTEHPHGPPRPGNAAGDREGLRRAVALVKERQPDKPKKQKEAPRLFLGGHSYGGRQATMLVAEAAPTDPPLVDGLLLLSYPLHPPTKPEQLRTGHFPKLNTPTFFVHGTRDPFGTTAEMNSALKLIPGRHALFEVEGAGHDLLGKKSDSDLPARIVSEFCRFVRESTQAAT
ncbi:MAG TPA: alpha/beta fold hydrolase [Candidatus Methylomirabilis sp.]|nr:alpha/beta fold hydrolase [Candidatus Methylomirabilis sp.]